LLKKPQELLPPRVVKTPLPLLKKGQSKEMTEEQAMSQREAASGLNLAGNEPMSGRGGSTPTMSEREEAAGLHLAGNDPLSGRGDPFYGFQSDTPSEEATDQGVHDPTDDKLPLSQSAFAAVVCVNGKPHFASIQGIIGDEIT